LIVNNQDGLRVCERALFDRGIRVLPASRGYLVRKFGSCRGVDLANRMMDMGYMFPGTEGRRRMYEVYPYGALQVLTGGRIPRYKKGHSSERRSGALQILELLRGWMPVDIPEWLDDEVRSVAPGGLKSTMDRVDAIISVLCVYCHWLYSGERTEVLGDVEDGFVLLPRR
jgi:predicted RNase H-like nuclease